MMNVLLLAEDCNPAWASLPAVGYKAARAIAGIANVTLVTHIRNREGITEHGDNLNVHYIDTEHISGPLYKLSAIARGGTKASWSTAMAFRYPTYIAFERQIWHDFKTALGRGEYDVVHRLTPMSPTLPSILASKSPVPFVIGPLNGGLRWPKAYRAELHREREWMTGFRKFYRYLPYVSSTYRHARAVLASFQHTISDLPKSIEDRVINFPEVGIDPGLFKSSENGAPQYAQKIPRFFFAGRLVACKLPEVLVRAFAEVRREVECQLEIVGDGDELPRMQAIVDEHQLADDVIFHGWKTQREVGDLMRQADIFVFPSIRELGAGVVVEAMACGLACIVVDYGGPGGLIDATRGIKVPLGDRDEIVRAFVQAMLKLARDPELRDRLKTNAQQHAMRCFSWDAKAKKTLEVYQWVSGQQAEKPVFDSVANE